MAILLGFCATKLHESKIVNQIIKKVNHKSIHNNVWHDYINPKGTSIQLLLNSGEIVYGTVSSYEENGENSWVVLKDGWIICENEEFMSDKNILKDTFNEVSMFKIKDIKFVNVYTNKDEKEQD